MLYSYFRDTGRLFVGCALLLLPIMLSELYEKPRREKDWFTEKKNTENLCAGHHFFDCTLSFPCHFLLCS